MRKLQARHRNKFFPFKTSNGVECVPVKAEELYRFLRKNFKDVFGTSFSSHFQVEPAALKKLKPLRKEYAKVHHEFFLFKKGKVTIGWSYGEMDDWETFYMRNTGILEEFRDNGVYGEFLAQLLKYLDAFGYQRVSSQHHPDNGAVIKAKLKAGFIIVGSENHERWGQLLKMVKILDPKRENFFKKKFM